MRIVFFTLALDAMPWITFHYPTFRKLKLDWEWWIMEGVARNVKCTQWVKGIPPRLSRDGTSEYIGSLNFDKRVIYAPMESWDGKVQMCNAPMGNLDINGPAILWQVDSDEIWEADQIHTVHRLFTDNPKIGRLECFCRYFVGPDIEVINRYCFGNDPRHGWKRIWRFHPGARFITHEPPELLPCPGDMLPREKTEELGLIFQHYAYATRKQVAFKEEYYGYTDLVQQWEQLQQNRTWPCRVSKFLKFLKPDEEALATRI